MKPRIGPRRKATRRERTPLDSLAPCSAGVRYGTTVKVLPPGPASFDHGPQPASEPGAHVAPAGQARAIALYVVVEAVSGTWTRRPVVTPRAVASGWPVTATKYSYSVAPGTGVQPT